jgi:hypothetical protein
MASGIYTSDSDIAMAAVHAGLLRPGQTGTIRIINKGRNSNYVGSIRNGVTSLSRPNESCGIQLELVAIDATPPPVTPPPPTPSTCQLVMFNNDPITYYNGNGIKCFGSL